MDRFWKEEWLWGFSSSISFIRSFFGVPIVGVAVITVFVILYLTSRRHKKHKNNITDYKISANIDSLRKKIEICEAQLNDSLNEQVKFALNPLIQDALKPNYSTLLKDIEAPGLAEVFDDHFRINTTHREQLDRKFKQMPGGSVGIAGPRGSGKTTLIRSYCDAGYWTMNTIRGQQPVLSIMTSAPVEYEVREFILHLFSMLCNRLLEIKEKPASTLTSISSKSNTSNQSTHRFLIVFNRLQIPLVIISIFLLLTGVTFGIATYIASTASKDSSSSIALKTSTEATKPMSNNTASTSNNEPDKTQQNPIITENKQDNTINNTANNIAQFGKAFGITPSTFLQAGLLILIPTLLLIYLYRSKMSNLIKQVIKSPEDEEEQIVRLAIDHLENIRFQRSYTTGWSGGVKMPLGVEIGLNESQSIAKKQLSLPEIVKEYQDFIKLLGREYQILIGIDELDKMESDEKAQRFMNEIKMIFGMEHCFYIISVSESAMSTFERRGLPFRDVFDSSLDEILYVEYLNFEHAKELVKRRVIGMPIPFISLSYCFSGGLARDLIRYCRSLLNERKGEMNDLSISEMCNKLIKSDLSAKLRALEIAVKNMQIKQGLAEFLLELKDLEVDNINENKLIEYTDKLIHEIIKLPQESDETEELAKQRRELNKFREELLAYLIYCATLCQFYNSKFNKQTLLDPTIIDILDKLAKARQSFALNLEMTRSILDDIRDKCGMSPIPSMP